jgi:hypothetical protein
LLWSLASVEEAMRRDLWPSDLMPVEPWEAEGPLGQALVDGSLRAAMLVILLWASGAMPPVGAALLLLAAAQVGLVGLLIR